MISTKNWTEIKRFKVESNSNIEERTWNIKTWTRFHVKDNLVQRYSKVYTTG